MRRFLPMIACLLVSGAHAGNNPCALENLVGRWEVETAASDGAPIRLTCRLDPHTPGYWLDCRSSPGEDEIYPLEGRIVDHHDNTSTAHLTENGHKVRAFARLYSCSLDEGVVGDASPWYLFEARTIPFRALRSSDSAASRTFPADGEY